MNFTFSYDDKADFLELIKKSSNFWRDSGKDTNNVKQIKRSYLMKS